MPSRNGISDAPAVRKLDLEQVAGAEILDRDNGADRLRRRGRRRAARSGRRDNIRPLRAAAARSDRPRPAEPRKRLGGCAVGDALEARDRGLAAVADAEQAALERRPHRHSSCAARLAALSENSFSRTSPLTPCAPATAASATRLSVDRRSRWLIRPSRPSRRPRPERPRRRLRQALRSTRLRPRPTGCSGVSAPSAGASSAAPSAAGARSAAASAARQPLRQRLRPELPRRRLPPAGSFLGGTAASSATASSAATTSSAAASAAASSATGSSPEPERQRPRRQQLRRPRRASHALRRAPWPSRPARAFFGLLRAGRSLMPAASRKRRTRSDGWAPTDSQCEMRSASSFTRSGESLASSGL